MPFCVWTAEQDAEITDLYQRGFSCGMIAAKVTTCDHKRTRNAVIGRLHRIQKDKGIIRPSPAVRHTVRNLWTEEELALLKSEQSSADIARRIGRTPATVVNKRHRMGLAGRVPPGSKRGTPRHHVRTSEISQVRMRNDAPIESPPEPRGDKPTLIDLKAGECKWPFGDPRHPEFHFCGSATGHVERPYCAGHSRLSYQPLRGADA